eukprot:TRINITY_DN65279_c0_g1_i1.p1 TRINITY_DN65279_c0_g1~~TRINITY_DN65279_c0_g1_i1.p1  ORF type:complete len:762 (+),score=294.98 TRINITY_DN65279_c0_g1_i1:87-2288(+)
MSHGDPVASPRQAATEAYLASLGDRPKEDLASREVREGLWRQQGAEGQGRILDAQLQDERAAGLDKAKERWDELHESNANLVSDLAKRMGVQTLPSAADPTGAIANAEAQVRATVPLPADARAKKQAATNQSLLDEVDRHEGKTLRQHARNAEAAVRPKQDVEQRNQEGLVLIRQHQEEYAWVHTPQMTRRDLYERCGLQVSWDTILLLHSRLAEKPGSDLSYLRLVQDLVEGRGDTKKMLQELSKCTPESNQCGAYTQAVTEFYNHTGKDFLDVPRIMKMLRQSDPMVERLRAEIDRMYDQRSHLLEEREDFVAAERVHEQTDDVLEELLKLLHERLSLLDGAGQDTSYVETAQQLAKRVRECTEQQEGHNKAPLNIPVEADIRHIDHHLAHLKDRLAEDEERCQRACAALEGELRANADRQLEKYDLVAQLHQEIVELGEQRRGIVDRLLKQKHDLEDNKAASEAVVPVALAHRKVLEELSKVLGEMVPTTQSTVPYVDRSLANIEQQFSEARGDTAETLLKEQREYYKVFHEFYLFAGELLYIRERRLEELEGQLDDTQWNIEMCRTVLDPNIKTYQERASALQQKIAGLEAEITEFRRRLDEAAAEAAPVEEALMEVQQPGDPPIVSPVILLQERNTAKAQEVIKRRREAVGRKGTRLETQEEVTANAVHQASVAKRAGGATSQMRPLAGDGAASPVASPQKRRELSEQRRKKYVERIRGTVDGAGAAR